MRGSIWCELATLRLIAQAQYTPNAELLFFVTTRCSKVNQIRPWLSVLLLALAALFASACGGTEGVVRAGELNANTRVFEVEGGLTVILKQTPGNPVVSVRLFFDGGSRNLNDENAGIEELALNVATSGGTVETPKAELSARLNAMGSTIGYNADLDFGTINMSTLSVYLADTWELFCEVIFTPAFPDSEIEIRREQLIQTIRMRQDNPDDRLVDLGRELLFEGHPYANRPIGTTQSVTWLDRDELVEHYVGLFDVSRMLLVVVGDVSEDELSELIGERFADLTDSETSLEPPPSLVVEGPSFAISEAQLPTTYILGMAPGPATTHEDYVATLLAMRHLSDELFRAIRTERNLTYAVSAGISTRLANYVYLYVTAVDPEATIPIMLSEIKRLQNYEIPEQDVDNLIAGFITRYYMGIDSNAAMAQELGWWGLFGGTPRQADAFVDNIRGVSAADIQRVANTYLNGFEFAAIGDPTVVSADTFIPPTLTPVE